MADESERSGRVEKVASVLAGLKDTVNALSKLTDIASLIRRRNATDDRTGYLVVQPYLAGVAVRSLADAVNVASEINELQHR
jgi:hypothetical protein